MYTWDLHTWVKSHTNESCHTSHHTWVKSHCNTLKHTATHRIIINHSHHTSVKSRTNESCHTYEWVTFLLRRPLENNTAHVNESRTCVVGVFDVMFQHMDRAAMHCNTLQYTAIHCNTSHHYLRGKSAGRDVSTHRSWCSILQCVAEFCSVCIEVFCSVLQCVAVCRSVLQCIAVRCSTLQCFVPAW